ncbi:MAG: ATP-grasp domain-containing protein [Syntrophorhabdaceae bacterium]|nr:ATP-grasp domain-containing protein [Syntrophorhabdaceae bacterium]
MERTIKKVLIANRGVPAVRIMHTCRDRKIATTAVYSTPDRLAHHVYMADTAVHIGDAPPAKSYLNIEKMIDAAHRSKVDAIHPGWGFLSENPDFAQTVIDNGFIWVGPPPEAIRLLGDKIQAKKMAQRASVPVIPGISPVENVEGIKKWMKAENVSYPIIIKAVAGGGGKGMLRVDAEAELVNAFNQTQSEAIKSFGDNRVMAKKYISHGRHIEVQIVADEAGNVVHLYERECTLQRRHQKIIEEAPSPSIDDDLRQEICFAAVRLMREVRYVSAGTVEFILDAPNRKFYFLEVNTRLQVEHGITELITGLDIVGMMFDIAMGKRLHIKQSDIKPNRWALEVRLNAENPRNFSPSFGRITRLLIPQGPGVRIASGVYEGADVPPYYDSLIMLVITAGVDRDDAIRVMDRALGRNLRVEGVQTLAPLLLAIIRHPAFKAGEFSTHFIENHMEELIASFRDRNSEDEVLKIGHYVAQVSALGPPPWM